MDKEAVNEDMSLGTADVADAAKFPLDSRHLHTLRLTALEAMVRSPPQMGAGRTTVDCLSRSIPTVRVLTSTTYGASSTTAL